MLPPAAVSFLRWWGRQRWLPFGLRDRVLRRLVHPDRQSPAPFVCDFFGMTYHGDLASFIDWTIYFYGAYEPGLLDFLRRTLAAAGPGAVFLDVGANVGQHSLFLARDAAEVHAFEPWDRARARLAANVGANHLTNILIHPFGLGAETADRPFYAPAGANLGTGSFVPDVNDNRPAGQLPVMRGDDAVAALALRRIDLIKIDTEGYEVQVLAGLAETLKRFRPVVVMELTAPAFENLAADGSGFADFQSLFGPDWRLFILGSHPERWRLTPFDGYFPGDTTLAAIPAEKMIQHRRQASRTAMTAKARP